MRSFLLFILISGFTLQSNAFFDSLYNKAASMAAVASGTEDLLSEIDNGNSLIKDVRTIGSTINETRELISDVDDTIYDVQHIQSSMSEADEVANKLHTLADKARRIKKIGKSLGIVQIDAPTAMAMEQIRTNTILDNMAADKKEQDLATEEKRLKRLTYIAKREKKADRSLSSALVKMKEKDKHSGTNFHPFPIPDGRAAVNESIMSQAFSAPDTSLYGI